MKRTLPTITVGILLLAGCGRTHHPVHMETSSEPPLSEPQPAESPHQAPAGGSFHGGQAPLAAAALGPQVDLGSVRLTAPEGWVRKQPRIDFIRAEFALPKAEGDPADGRLTVSVAGGTIDDNVRRWQSQFASEAEQKPAEKISVGDFEVTLVDLSGTFTDQRGPFAPAQKRADYRMLGAIVPIGGQLHFIKAYGPAKTMAQQEKAFQTFVRSLCPVKKAP